MGRLPAGFLRLVLKFTAGWVGTQWIDSLCRPGGHLARNVLLAVWGERQGLVRHAQGRGTYLLPGVLLACYWREAGF